MGQLTRTWSFITRSARFRSAAFAAIVLSASTAIAQPVEDAALRAGSRWILAVDAQAFLAANIQERKFRDFHVIESQNWLMLSARRRLGQGTLSLHGMLSFEDFTFQRYGSPQVFQAGETFGGAFLIDYQHPHDLIMAANARFDWPVSDAWRVFVGGGPVGAPAIGPQVFMHRSSSEGNPTAPLGHHNLDSTHVTHGVITVGATRGEFTVEASGFHGREPDEDRIALELGPIDSYSGRLSWRRNGWHAQVSAAHLKFPDPTEFTDHDLFTASIGRDHEVAGYALSWTVAFGLNREPSLDVSMPAWLAEATWRASPRHRVYARAELLDRDILTPGGYDPPGFDHPHILSQVAALTVGYERQLASTRAGRISAGADATVYARDANLADNYGQPFSAHMFLPYRLK